MLCAFSCCSGWLALTRFFLLDMHLFTSTIFSSRCPSCIQINSFNFCWQPVLFGCIPNIMNLVFCNNIFTDFIVLHGFYFISIIFCSSVSFTPDHEYMSVKRLIFLFRMLRVHLQERRRRKYYNGSTSWWGKFSYRA